MIPRYQRILFWTLTAATLLMALFLLHGCEQAREKFTRRSDQTPLTAPVARPSETVRLALANDADGSITLVSREIPLPTTETARVRFLLAHLIAEYSSKDSAHPLESGPAIDDVFLLDLPLKPSTTPTAATANDSLPPSVPSPNPSLHSPHNPGNTRPDGLSGPPRVPGGQLAVINLHSSFADRHPSGIEPEALTINSILGTLYANFPRIQQVRFLVDGQPRQTLNGHADLTRTYQVTDTATSTAQEAH